MLPLTMSHPSVLEGWDYNKNTEEPSSKVAGSHYAAYWICKEFGHSFKMEIRRRVEGVKCSICSNKILLPGFNDMPTMSPKAALLWNYSLNESQPEDYFVSSSKKVWWQCDKGQKHSFFASVKSVAFSRNSCGVCRGLQIAIGFNDLPTTHSLLTEEWDHDLNTLTPYEVTAGSSAEVYWKCKEWGHSFKAMVSSRTRPHGAGKCGICLNQIILRYFNDLETINPILAAEWDYGKNTLQPFEVSAQSDIMVWWKCAVCNHGWKSSPHSRSRNNNQGKSECSVCIGRVIKPGYNDFATKFPEIMKEWDLELNTINPNAISGGRQEKAFWKCNKGHTWKATLQNRTKAKSGCPHCAQGSVSKAEIALLEAIKISPYFNSTSNGNFVVHTEDTQYKKINVDINTYHTQSGLNVIIEYDGEYWHGLNAPGGDIRKKDLHKTLILLGLGYIVVRVRENSLFLLDLDHPNLIQINYIPQKDYVNSSLLVGEIAKRIKRI